MLFFDSVIQGVEPLVQAVPYGSHDLPDAGRLLGLLRFLFPLGLRLGSGLDLFPGTLVKDGTLHRRFFGRFLHLVGLVGDGRTRLRRLFETVQLLVVILGCEEHPDDAGSSRLADPGTALRGETADRVAGAHGIAGEFFDEVADVDQFGAAARDDDAASPLLAESARAIPDLDAQARAYYNRGNTLYALSDADPTSTNASALIAEALQSYENAIALAPSAPDYKANYELALLKQQQIQQQQQQQQQQNQDQSQDQQNQDQSSSDDQQQSQQQDQQQEQQQEQQEQAQQQSQSQSQESQESQESQQQSQEPPSEQMTPEEATQLLDAMRAREQSQRDQLKPLFGRPIPVENDW